jgi:hypothetical protein
VRDAAHRMSQLIDDLLAAPGATVERHVPTDKGE